VLLRSFFARCSRHQLRHSNRPDWTYEVKWNGHRAVAIKDGKRVRLVSRNQNDLTRDYPQVVASLGSRAEADVALDGEIVAVE
jgi:bifunctional non-homologous end joining protein LigD